MTRPTKTALVWHDLEADTVRIIGSWDDIQWRELGSGFVGQEELFPARVSLAISRTGRIAQGNTLDYCITLWGQHDTPRRVCRDWRRAPVGDAIRSPDPELVPDGQREVLQAQWRVQKVGDQLPSFDRIRFGEDERLWVRTLGNEMSDVHPFILGRRPELGPRYRSWDVFSAEGRLERTVWLPSLFDPRVMMREELYGFYELPSGEIVIGRAEAQVPRRTGK